MADIVTTDGTDPAGRSLARAQDRAAALNGFVRTLSKRDAAVLRSAMGDPPS